VGVYARRDGTTFLGLLSGRRLYKRDGSFQGLVGVIQDVTERRRLEDQLAQAQKMEAIGTLAGGIAYEFNNILGIILGNAELAVDDVPEWNPASGFLKEIRTAAIRAKDVVRELLTFSRKSEETRKPLELSRVIREAIHMLRATLAHHPLHRLS